MFPDEPDEDAASLSDEALLRAYLCPEPPSVTPTEPDSMPDWPPLRRQTLALSIDDGTLDWFRAHHANWQREIRLVLKAWVAAQTDHAQAGPAGGPGAPG